jgi:Acyclic terpene utilisation family protein AtuA
MTHTVRIGNAQAFWGDRSDAAAEMLAREPDLDYLTLDYLAEVSMSILAVQRERDPAAGYAKDFVEVVRSLVPYWNAGGRCRLIANAGGLNPKGCADACAKALEEAGCRALKIAVVNGDDVLAMVRAASLAEDEGSSGVFQNLDSGAPLTGIAARLVTANAYMGSSPIAQALAGGADVVITGRVADPSLVVGACLHHFGWEADDWDRLAGATVAGHLIECGTQVCGGISTDWLDLPDPAHIGFPIVEVADNGSCVVTKPGGTGGAVTEETVKEQLLYEIGDPAGYLSPDVRVSFLSLKVEDLGADRVGVSGAKGQPGPNTLKVSATYRDGFWAAGTLTIIGRDARAKAQKCGEIVLSKVREAGHELRESVIECLGGKRDSADTSGPGWEPVDRALLRVAVSADSSKAVEQFTKELMPLITAGPQGTTGYAEGRPRVHPLFRYWPCLIDRTAVVSKVEILTTTGGDSSARTPQGVTKPDSAPRQRSATLATRAAAVTRSRLRDLARARSGDKGTSANIGVIARCPEDYEFLKGWLTAERVASFFRSMGISDVIRYELPNLGALNFVLKGILSSSLRIDAQGKALGQMLLEMPLN